MRTSRALSQFVALSPMEPQTWCLSNALCPVACQKEPPCSILSVPSILDLDLPKQRDIDHDSEPSGINNSSRFDH